MRELAVGAASSRSSRRAAASSCSRSARRTPGSCSPSSSTCRASYARELNASGERFEHAQAHFDVETAERENQHLYAECRKIVAARKAAPLDPARTSISALLAVRVDGEPLDDEFVAGSLRQLLIAAHVAPTALLASAVDHLARDPELQARLRADPALDPGRARGAAAALRAQPGLRPHRDARRRGPRPDDPRGRDGGARPAVGEPRPRGLRRARRRSVLDRSPNPHLAFGHGPHKCAGAADGARRAPDRARGAARADVVVRAGGRARDARLAGLRAGDAAAGLRPA